MPEENSPLPRLLELLVTKSYAVLASFAVTLGGATVLLLGERLDRPAILTSAGALAGILLATIWTAVTITTRLRSKISKMEHEILSLKSRPSPALEDTTDCDTILIEVSRAGGDYERFAAMTGFSQIKVDDCIHRLKVLGFIEFNIGEEWANNSRYVITDAGRRYLIDNHLVA